MDGDVARQLLAVRSRADDIRKLLVSMSVHDTNWLDILGQYIALSGQFARLSEVISPMLGHFVVVPKNLPPDPHLVPEWLRTKLIPELEEYDKQVLHAYTTSVGQTQLVAQEDVTQANSYKLLCADVGQLYDNLSERVLRSKPEKSTQPISTLSNTKEMVASVTLGSVLRIDGPALQSLPTPVYIGAPTNISKEDFTHSSRQVGSSVPLSSQIQYTANYPSPKQQNAQVFTTNQFGTAPPQQSAQIRPGPQTVLASQNIKSTMVSIH
jgi:hypothetical protein